MVRPRPPLYTGGMFRIYDLVGAIGRVLVGAANSPFLFNYQLSGLLGIADN